MKKYMPKIASENFGLDQLLTIPFTVLFRNLRKFLVPLGMYLGLFGLVIVASFLFGLLSGVNVAEIEALLDSPESYGIQEMMVVLQPILPILVIALLVGTPIYIAISILIQNLLVITSAKILREEEYSLGEAMQIALHRVPAGFSTALAIFVIYFVLAMVVAAVLLAGSLLGPFVLCVVALILLILVPVLLYLHANLLFAPTIAVLEPFAFIQAIGRSLGLVRGRIGKIMLYLLALFIIIIIVSIPLGIIDLIFQVIENFTESNVILFLIVTLITGVMSTIIEFFTLTLLTIGTTTWYLNLLETENVESDT